MVRTMYDILERIKELLKSIPADADFSLGIVVATEDDDGDTSYSFFIKGYPEDVSIGAAGLLTVAEREQKKLEQLFEYPLEMENGFLDTNDLEIEDGDNPPPSKKKNIN